jgi:hypothetical protein
LGIQELIPCCIEAVDNLEDMYLEGQNILQNEVDCAKNIPETQRKLLDKSAININRFEEEETILEKYDQSHLYFK